VKATRLFVLTIPLLILGCSSGPSNEPPAPLNPSAGPSVSETSERVKADPQEIKSVLDLPEYPGATVVDDARLINPAFSPDERRYVLSRKSTDSPEKVAKFYEKELKQPAAEKEKSYEIFGQTSRGNGVRVNIEPDGTGSSFVLVVIAYLKK